MYWANIREFPVPASITSVVDAPGAREIHPSPTPSRVRLTSCAAAVNRNPVSSGASGAQRQRALRRKPRLAPVLAVQVVVPEHEDPLAWTGSDVERRWVGSGASVQAATPRNGVGTQAERWTSASTHRHCRPDDAAELLQRPLAVARRRALRS